MLDACDNDKMITKEPHVLTIDDKINLTSSPRHSSLSMIEGAADEYAEKTMDVS